MSAGSYFRLFSLSQDEDFDDADPIAETGHDSDESGNDDDQARPVTFEFGGLFPVKRLISYGEGEFQCCPLHYEGALSIMS